MRPVSRGPPVPWSIGRRPHPVHDDMFAKPGAPQHPAALEVDARQRPPVPGDEPPDDAARLHRHPGPDRTRYGVVSSTSRAGIQG